MMIFSFQSWFYEKVFVTRIDTPSLNFSSCFSLIGAGPGPWPSVQGTGASGRSRAEGLKLPTRPFFAVFISTSVLTDTRSEGLLYTGEWLFNPRVPGTTPTWAPPGSTRQIWQNLLGWCFLNCNMHVNDTGVCLKKFFFNWSIVDLEYCVSFGCMAKWISSTYTQGSGWNADPDLVVPNWCTCCWSRRHLEWWTPGSGPKSLLGILA